MSKASTAPTGRAAAACSAPIEATLAKRVIRHTVATSVSMRRLAPIGGVGCGNTKPAATARLPSTPTAPPFGRAHARARTGAGVVTCGRRHAAMIRLCSAAPFRTAELAPTQTARLPVAYAAAANAGAGSVRTRTRGDAALIVVGVIATTGTLRVGVGRRK